MNRRWQALYLCPDMAIIVIIEIFQESLFEIFHTLKRFADKAVLFEQANEIQVFFPTHALSDALVAFLPEHSLILFTLVLLTLVGMENQAGSVRNFRKSQA